MPIARVAQLVEHLICNQVVGGSIPSPGTNLVSSAGTPTGIRRSGAFVMKVGEGRMPEGRTTQDAVVEGSTPSLGTIFHEPTITPAPLARGALLIYEHLSCNQESARPWKAEGRAMQDAIAEGSSVGCAVLLRRPIQGNHPWLPARPGAGTPALNHRSRPSPGTIPISQLVSLERFPPTFMWVIKHQCAEHM